MTRGAQAPPPAIDLTAPPQAPALRALMLSIGKLGEGQADYYPQAVAQGIAGRASPAST